MDAAGWVFAACVSVFTGTGMNTGDLFEKNSFTGGLFIKENSLPTGSIIGNFLLF